MFRIESYVTPILLSYVDKYVRDFKPADAQVSLWAGGVVLHNLVLKPDVLQKEVALPFTLISGRIHELLIQVPWTKIISEPIVVTIDTIECVLSLHPPTPEESTSSDTSSTRTHVVEAPPGYMQAIVRRIVSNISLKVHHLIVKYVQDDIVLSLNVEHLSVESCGPDWVPTFADIDQNKPVIRRAVLLDNLTLCLDRADSDGKIRYYQEPLLYRCQLNLRMLTRLVSANIRCANSLHIELRSSKLAWGVTSDQLMLLLRLLKEGRDVQPKPNSPSMRQRSNGSTNNQSQPVSSITAEPTRSGSWSEWAWSWMPSGYDSTGGTDAGCVLPTPIPISFSAYLDDVSLTFKVMEIEAANRKRPRSFLEFKALNIAAKGYLCVPTAFKIKIGVRSILMKSQDKCTCGHIDTSFNNEEPTFYIIKIDDDDDSGEWSWPENDFTDNKVEEAEAAEEHTQPPKAEEVTNKIGEDGSETSSSEGRYHPHPLDSLWQKMDPLVFIEYVHERSPPTSNINPYDNPPKDFEYSDWLEECGLDIQVRPIRLRVCMGLIHRIETLTNIWRESINAEKTEVTSVLTVEDMDHLLDNLPQRRINIMLKQLQLLFYPWDHSLTERPVMPAALLVVDVPLSNIVLDRPLYPHRVCSAASQIPEDHGALWRGAKLHISTWFNSLEVKIMSSTGERVKPCARLDIKVVMHILLNQHYFKNIKKEPVLFNYSIKIREANISGSTPRLETAYQVLWSLSNKNYSNLLRCSTLAKDALRDEELVALDLNFEEATLRGYHTKNVNTHVFVVHSARGTVLQSAGYKVVNQAWIFSAPDIPSNTPFLRGALQWCAEPAAEAYEYLGLWSEPIAIAIDPLFVTWFAYKPRPTPLPEPEPSFLPKTISSNLFMMRRRFTPPSSSGRGGSRSGSAAELVHQRSRSIDTSSDKEAKDTKGKEGESPQKDRMLEVHDRLKRTLITVELGLVVVYVTTTTASAVDCATLRLAMERHAMDSGSVLAICLGRWSMHSSGFTRHIWQDIRHDGPTFNIRELGDCFPWKISLGDVSCYTLEYSIGTERTEKFVGGLRSQLKVTHSMVPRTILDLVSTTVTLSVVSKSVVFKSVVRKPESKKTATGTNKVEKRMRFFTGGGNFKPTSLKEFVRGPSNREKGMDNKSASSEAEQMKEAEEEQISQSLSSGPIVSIGLNLHADTPPIMIRLDQEQIHIVAAAIHCLKHMISLLRATFPVTPPRKYDFQPSVASIKSLTKPLAEDEEEMQRTVSTTSQDNKSDLIPIYQARPQHEMLSMALHLKKFIWFQWVVNRVTAIISSEDTKLVFAMEDLITTLDIQEHYRQAKMKMASFSVKHYMKDEGGDWKTSILGGRVLEVREPTSSKEDQFLSVTITRAQISTLPASWKQELNPKMLDLKQNNDNMFEIYAVLAPMEAVLEPSLLERILTLIHETYSSTNCPMDNEIYLKPVMWPFCYLSAGGMRLVICSMDKQGHTDDSIVLEVNKVTLNPHPENPISRRPLALESSWLPSEGSLEGRQYDVFIEDVSIHSTQLSQLIAQEKYHMEFLKKGSGVENPARKWSQIDELTIVTPILHPINLNCVFAPALFFGEALICGSGLEINILTDCAIDLSIDHLELIKRNIEDFSRTLCEREKPTASMEFVEQTVCPYAYLLNSSQPQDNFDSLSDNTISDEQLKTERNASQSLGGDSGVETVASQTTNKSREFEQAATMKKSASGPFLEQISDPREHVEIFVTMGTIELTLYTVDDGSPEMTVLRLPPRKIDSFVEEEKDPNSVAQQNEQMSPASRISRSLTEMIRHKDIGRTRIILADITLKQPRAFRMQGNIPLFHVTLQQPNLYYWKKKLQRNIQVSLFDAWVGLGDVQTTNGWKLVLLSTSRGVPDPATDIPPALATMKITMSYPSSHTSLSTKSRGSLNLDIERPVMFEVCSDRLKRIIAMRDLIAYKLWLLPKYMEPVDSTGVYKLRRLMANYSIETAVIQTGQVGLSGSEGVVGWDSASLQAACGSRPDRLNIRALVCALLVGSGPTYEPRHQMLQPLKLGIEIDALWETWRRVEGGDSCRDPTLRIRIDMDHVIVELRPVDLDALSRIESVATDLRKWINRKESSEYPSSTNSGESAHSSDQYQKCKGHHSCSSTDSTEYSDHFYKDDLRSGAFKIVSGGQLPMAYQVVLSGNTVAWRYPHPRTITRLVAFPLPGQNEEINCVLELYDRLTNRWEPYTYFSIPVSDPKEHILYGPTPEALFCTVWRFRVRSSDKTEENHTCEFQVNRFMPRPDPLTLESQPVMGPTVISEVTAEQLSGVLRVDSYFAPRLLAHTRITLQITALEVNLHNSLPAVCSQSKPLEGYYVSKPLRQSHRVLMLFTRELLGHFSLGLHSVLLLCRTNLSSYILECGAGTMEKLVEEFLIQSSSSVPLNHTSKSLLHLRTSKVHVKFNIPRLRTLQSLFSAWKIAVSEYILKSPEKVDSSCPIENPKGKRDAVLCSIKELEGLVSLWINNTCVTALRVGQEESDEVVLLEAGSSLAYRWRNPTAPKRVRFALTNPSVDWHWSVSVPFTAGRYRVRLENPEMFGKQRDSPGVGVYLHVSVEEVGAYRSMNLCGHLVLANILRFELLYKVRARFVDQDTWRTISSGELAKETVCRSVLCGANTEMMLKIKLSNHQTGWSGDIPLKECPKENVPWLVKVPSEGDMSYVSVWCRVVRARSDGRILATIWPLYVLYSHLPLDTDVLIVTETMHGSSDLPTYKPKPPPLILSAPGRGFSTQLMAPGTTSAKHSLSFQYRNIECPVTREAVPLHYGVTDTSVFDKRAPVDNIEYIVQDVGKWLERSSRHAKSSWPYSIVSRHWPSAWQPALLQPRCDVTVRYRAVRAGGGCSLEVHLSPIVLLCNASPIALTLRAHDAAPLCKLEPGTALSPPFAILNKPFFMSVEMGRETFVSGKLEVTAEELGRYSEPPPGLVALDRSTNFAVQCNQKVALFTLFYEIKEDINVLGITSTFAFVNKLETDILVSAIATPVEETNVFLHPKTFKVVQPSKEEQSEMAMPLCRFWLRSRWRGGDAAQLNTFLCLALPLGVYPASSPVPVRLGVTPARKPIALLDQQKRSVAAVVTQHIHEGRTVITIAEDQCPQYLVYNRTNEKIAVAQAVHSDQEPNPTTTEVVPDCEGARWRCVVEPQATVHYSTPAYCVRHHPSTADHFPCVSFLTFALVGEDSELSEWSHPVAAAEGEQLVQLARGLTIKMRAHIYPHSTLIELQPIDERDISASDIRNRLLGSISSDDIIRPKISKSTASPFSILERMGADNNLLSASKIVAPSSRHERENTPEGLKIFSEGNLATWNTSISENARTSDQDINIQETEKNEKENYVDVTEEQNIIKDQMEPNELIIAHPTDSFQVCSFELPYKGDLESELVRCKIDNIVIEMSVASETEPLLALHVDRVALFCSSENKHTKTVCSIMGLQVDNLQYESGQFDFAVVAATRGEPVRADDWPPLYNMFLDTEHFCLKKTLARFLLTVCYDKWSVAQHSFHELTELEIKLGPLALYIEDAYIAALIDFLRVAVPEPESTTTLLAEARVLQRPLRLRLLHIEPIELNLTLHTAVRIYIALDQSPLNLNSFKLRDVMMSSEQLAHALTVHYLSAAILGAGWVVGGLELLGAPGALAARVGGATGGVRGIASAAAAGLLRSLSAWAGSLARNLDILAGDEEHARRAAAARRRPPHSFVEGLITGMTNFAINILGAVGGLAHHPLVGVAVGETESGTAALRRSLLGAFAKPLSATADLVAYAGQGLLQQTGWDTMPQPRALHACDDSTSATAGWQRDCVRWTFRLAELSVLSGFKVLLNNAHLLLLFTHKYIVVVDPESEKVMEMIDLRFCTLSPYQGAIIELSVSQKRLIKVVDSKAVDEDDEYRVSAAAMARVARYTGAESATSSGETRVLMLLPSPGESHSLHATIAAAIHNNTDTHFSFL